jgi:hypothetical protein
MTIAGHKLHKEKTTVAETLEVRTEDDLVHEESEPERQQVCVFARHYYCSRYSYLGRRFQCILKTSDFKIHPLTLAEDGEDCDSTGQHEPISKQSFGGIFFAVLECA